MIPRSSCCTIELEPWAERNGILTRGGLLLQAWALSVRQTLMGYYLTTVDSPLKLVVNPEGNEERCRRVVWNNGNSRTGSWCGTHAGANRNFFFGI